MSALRDTRKIGALVAVLKSEGMANGIRFSVDIGGEAGQRADLIGPVGGLSGARA